MHIRLAKTKESKTIFDIYLKAKEKLDEKGLFQWTENYPTLEIMEQDIKNNFLYVIHTGDLLLGAINLSEVQEVVYDKIEWLYNPKKVLVLHRLVVSPEYQGKGIARALMDFAEQYAVQNKYTSIRLDVYSQNKQVIELYKRRKYISRGTVRFPNREYPFFCMEKEIITNPLF